VGTCPVPGAVDVHLLELPQPRNNPALSTNISERVIGLSDAETIFLIEEWEDIWQLSKILWERRGKVERFKLSGLDSRRLGSHRGSSDTWGEKCANAWHVGDLYFAPLVNSISK
jgi:hypothetical protein